MATSVSTSTETYRGRGRKLIFGAVLLTIAALASGFFLASRHQGNSGRALAHPVRAVAAGENREAPPGADANALEGAKVLVAATPKRTNTPGKGDEPYLLRQNSALYQAPSALAALKLLREFPASSPDAIEMAQRISGLCLWVVREANGEFFDSVAAGPNLGQPERLKSEAARIRQRNAFCQGISQAELDELAARGGQSATEGPLAENREADLIAEAAALGNGGGLEGDELTESTGMAVEVNDLWSIIDNTQSPRNFLAAAELAAQGRSGFFGEPPKALPTALGQDRIRLLELHLHAVLSARCQMIGGCGPGSPLVLGFCDSYWACAANASLRDVLAVAYSPAELQYLDRVAQTLLARRRPPG